MDDSKVEENLRGWHRKPPTPLPDNFAAETVQRAVVVKQNLTAMLAFKISSVLIVLVVGLVTWQLSLEPSGSDLPPAFSLFHRTSSIPALD